MKIRWEGEDVKKAGLATLKMITKCNGTIISGARRMPVTQEPHRSSTVGTRRFAHPC